MDTDTTHQSASVFTVGRKRYLVEDLVERIPCAAEGCPNFALHTVGETTGKPPAPREALCQEHVSAWYARVTQA